MHTRTWITLALACVLTLAPHFRAHAKPPTTAQPKLSTVELRIKEFKLTCEVARSEKAKEIGLMFRKDLGINEGMIFIFENDRQASFWMKNTSIPLSVAYIDSTGKILEIHDLAPFNEYPVASKSDKIRFALEVNQGWFAARKIPIGTPIMGISNLSIARTEEPAQ